MNIKLCSSCNESRAFILRPKTRKPICKECFFSAFETEIHYTIKSNNLFKKGDRVVLGASGGKDSTVLIHLMSLLNKRYDYGLDLQLLSIDEGIKGYRDDSLETVKRNEYFYNLPLTILSYKDLYEWSMDEIVKQIGLTNNCTFCGVFRRQALDRGAIKLNAKKIVTGHNADDVAETVLMNILRGDFFRLGKSVDIVSGKDEDGITRCKPFKYTYEKEIVLYAYHKKLDYFSTECKYSPNAYRGYVRELIKDLEVIRPSTVIDIIHSGEQILLNVQAKIPEKKKCIRCGFIASNALCKACVLLESLNKNKAKIQLKMEDDHK